MLALYDLAGLIGSRRVGFPSRVRVDTEYENACLLPVIKAGFGGEGEGGGLQLRAWIPGWCWDGGLRLRGWGGETV